jgi:glutathione synthase/RimK-type ligase-like ATP-grasp enzyme
MKIALVTAVAAFALDEDLAPLQQALHEAGVDAPIVAWDDMTVSWRRFDAAVLRSTWDYTERLSEFLAWAAAVQGQTLLLNPLEVIKGNVDKHYLAKLESKGIAIVPSAFAEPGEDAAKALAAFLERFPKAGDFVVKPAIGAGSRDAQRYRRSQRKAAVAHVKRLLAEKRSVLMQPYLDSVDEAGETALMFFDGEFSHAIRKGPLLVADEGPTEALFAAETISAREPGKDELKLAKATLKALGTRQPLAYARVDLIRGSDGAPRVLELELTEPSLFFPYGEGSSERFVEVLKKRVAARKTG